MSSFLLSCIFFNCQMGVDAPLSWVARGASFAVQTAEALLGQPGACKEGYDVCLAVPGQRGRQSRQQLVSGHVLLLLQKPAQGPGGRSERG